MYIVNKVFNKNDEFLEIKSPCAKTQGRIYLKAGASLQALILNRMPIIKEIDNHSIEKPYASAVLFPFIGRVKNQSFTFKDKLYQNSDTNAKLLHGFLFDKEFSFIEQQITAKFASIVLKREGISFVQGLAYNYAAQIHYTFTLNYVTLNFTIKNLGSSSFPFSVGWHPYFASSNLYNSSLVFESNQKIDFDSEMIPKSTINHKQNKGFQIKNSKFDDCYIIKNSSIQFKTPNYSICIKSSCKNSFLQVYTPPNHNKLIAVELLTGVPNNFNNNIGLQFLEPKQQYTVTWSIILDE
ncbi:MAG: aldose 1-epimerase [Tenacibaculum sp.]